MQAPIAIEERMHENQYIIVNLTILRTGLDVLLPNYLARLTFSLPGCICNAAPSIPCRNFSAAPMGTAQSAIVPRMSNITALQPVTTPVLEHRLTLAEILEALVADGMVARTDADQLIADRSLHRTEHHPLGV